MKLGKGGPALPGLISGSGKYEVYMKKYSITLRDLYRTIWVRADRYEVIEYTDAFGNPCKQLRFFVGQTRILDICTSFIDKFQYWPVLSEPRRIEL